MKKVIYLFKNISLLLLINIVANLSSYIYLLFAILLFDNFEPTMSDFQIKYLTILLFVLLFGRLLVLPIAYKILENSKTFELISKFIANLKRSFRLKLLVLAIALFMYFPHGLHSSEYVDWKELFIGGTFVGLFGSYIVLFIWWFIEDKFKLILQRNPRLNEIYLNLKPILIKSLKILGLLLVTIGLTQISLDIIYSPKTNSTTVDKVYEYPIDYEEALNSTWERKRTKHFPQKIPSTAKNIRLYKSSNSWFGSEEIALGFNIDKKYIKTLIDKYKYVSVEGPLGHDEPDNRSYTHGVITNNLLEKPSDINSYKFYIIGDNTTVKTNFPIEYGIAVDCKHNDIIFYYALVD